MSKMKELVAILDDELGGTANLNFRVGLHSGGVTVRTGCWKSIQARACLESPHCIVMSIYIIMCAGRGVERRKVTISTLWGYCQYR